MSFGRQPKALTRAIHALLFVGKKAHSSLSLSLSLSQLVFHGFTNHYYIIKRRPPISMHPISQYFLFQTQSFFPLASKPNHSHQKICLHEHFNAHICMQHPPHNMTQHKHHIIANLYSQKNISPLPLVKEKENLESKCEKSDFQGWKVD